MARRCGMVYTDAEFVTTCAAHDIGFDLFGAKVVEGLTSGAIDLGELGVGAGEEGAVASIWGIAGTE
jgi:hypothetical protein